MILTCKQGYAKFFFGAMSSLVAVQVSFVGCTRTHHDGQQVLEVKLEHGHFPAHWPKSIFAAAERLAILCSEDSDSLSNTNISIERETSDLCRWLPELAADSDLDESTFVKIDAWSTRFCRVLELAANNTTKQRHIVQSIEFKSFVESLNELCQVELSRIKSLE